MKYERKIKAAIIGSGGIGALYDFGSPPEVILTHLRGYLNSQHIDLQYICDLDTKCLDKMKSAVSNVDITTDFRNLFDKGLDVISICTPDHTHINILSEFIDYSNVSLIFSEKPLSPSLSEIIELQARLKRITIQVNFSRRWLPEVKQIKEEIISHSTGDLISINIQYYNGFIHNGIHIIDLLSFFFDPTVINSKVIFKKKYKSLDYLLSGIYELLSPLYKESFFVSLHSFSDDQPSLFEIDLVFQNKRIVITESNGTFVYKYSVEKNSILSSLKEFKLERIFEINYSNAMVGAIKDIENYFLYKKDIDCGISESIKTHNLMEAFLV